jgi:hypothetical protein
MSKKQKDWLQVNAIAAGVFSLMGIVSSIAIITKPEQLSEILKTIPSETNVTSSLLTNMAYGLLTVCSLLLAHIVWTYVLIRKNKAQFDV